MGTVGQSALFVVTFAAIAGCRDVARFSTRGDHFEGTVTRGNFVRAGIVDDATMCLSLDTDRLQDAPGALTTSDGRFRGAPLRPIPQIWHDPLSTLSFGDGRIQNLLYVATPTDEGQDVMVVVSLLQSDGVEVRLLRGAPAESDGGAPRAPQGPLFGVFNLDRRPGACPL